MADNQDTGTSQGDTGTSQNSPGLGQFYAYAKRVAPDATDTDIMKAYQSAGVADGSQDSLAAGVQMVKEAAQAPTTSAVNAPIATPAPVQLQTQLPSSYAGTTQEKANPLNPGASAMSQFDPQQMNNVYEAQRQAYAASMPSRSTGNLLAASTGNTGVMTANQDQWKNIDAQNMLQTLGKQKALQEQATAGITNAGEVQKQNIAAGKYTTDQAAAAIKQASDRVDLITKQLPLAAQQDLNNPTSAASMAGRVNAKKTLKEAGYSDAEIAQAVPNEMTAYQAANIVAIGADQLKQMKAAADIGHVKGQTAQAYGAANASNAQAGASSAQAAQTRQQTNIQGQIMFGAGAKPGTTNGIVNPAAASQYNASGFNYTPGAAAAQEGTVANQLATEKGLQQYDSGGQTALKGVMTDLKNGVYSGAGAGAWAQNIPASKQADLQQKLYILNQQMPGLFPTDANGKVVIQMDGRSIANTIAQRMAAMEITRQRQSAINQKYQGNASAFSSSPDAAKIGQMVPMINKQMQTILVPPKGTAGYNAAVKDGYTEASNYSSLLGQ